MTVRKTLLAITLLALFTPIASSTVYDVGPGMTYINVGDVPWESIAPGDTVNIYYRSTPYYEKFCIAVAGTAANPVTVRGVPGPNGELPILDGNGATTRLALDYYNDQRCVIKVGGGAVPPDIYTTFITFENLEIRSARPPYQYYDDAGTLSSYVDSAGSFYVCYGSDITVRNCILHDHGNGFFVASGNTVVSRNILVEGCYIYDNGNDGSIYEHNSYCACIGITYQYNHYGPLRAGCAGNALKDRSADMVVRYNWIESGNRQLDLVNGEDSKVITSDPLYNMSWVYGNILIEDMMGNRQMVHFGNDGGSPKTARKGPLYFYNNTCVSTRTDANTLFRSDVTGCILDFRNSIFETSTTAVVELSSDDSKATINMTHCWLNTGWVKGGAILNDDGTSITGDVPGFVDAANQNFRLRFDSPCVDAGGPLNSGASMYPVTMQYVEHCDAEARPVDETIDIGAYEY